MEFFKGYVMLVLSIPDDQFRHIHIDYNTYPPGVLPPFLKDSIDIAYEFRQNHPFLSKIPFINWIIYKKIFRNEIHKIICEEEKKWKTK